MEGSDRIAPVFVAGYRIYCDRYGNLECECGQRGGCPHIAQLNASSIFVGLSQYWQRVSEGRVGSDPIGYAAGMDVYVRAKQKVFAQITYASERWMGVRPDIAPIKDMTLKNGIKLRVVSANQYLRVYVFNPMTQREFNVLYSKSAEGALQNIDCRERLSKAGCRTFQYRGSCDHTEIVRQCYASWFQDEVPVPAQQRALEEKARKEREEKERQQHLLEQKQLIQQRREREEKLRAARKADRIRQRMEGPRIGREIPLDPEEQDIQTIVIVRRGRTLK